MIIRNVARVFASVVLVSAPLVPFVAHAGTDSANLGVSAVVAANCTISTSALAFGSYDPVDVHSASALTGTGGVTVTCTSGAAAVIELDEGANEAGGSAPDAPLRRLVFGGSNYLSYGLFSDAGFANIWATGAAVDVPHTGDGTATNLTVYGRVTAGQNVPAGTYTDTVVATVTF